MPTLKQLTCQIERAGSNSPMREYATAYSDGFVQTYVAIPTISTPFSIHLTSKGYIAPGLAMFVYMDGSYQCNRNQLDLKLPNEATSMKSSEINFRVRQKEQKLSDGTWLGKEWRFEKLNVVSSNAQKLTNLVSGKFDHIGTIEVVVLRCQANTTLHSPPVPAQTCPTPKTVAPNKRGSSAPSDVGSKAQTKEQPPIRASSVQSSPISVAFEGLFDGASDPPDSSFRKVRFGTDGSWDDGSRFQYHSTARSWERHSSGSDRGDRNQGHHGPSPRRHSPSGGSAVMWGNTPNHEGQQRSPTRHGGSPIPPAVLIQVGTGTYHPPGVSIHHGSGQEGGDNHSHGREATYGSWAYDNALNQATSDQARQWNESKEPRRYGETRPGHHGSENPPSQRGADVQVRQTGHTWACRDKPDRRGRGNGGNAAISGGGWHTGNDCAAPSLDRGQSRDRWDHQSTSPSVRHSSGDQGSLAQRGRGRGNSVEGGHGGGHRWRSSGIWGGPDVGSRSQQGDETQPAWQPSVNSDENRKWGGAEGNSTPWDAPKNTSTPWDAPTNAGTEKQPQEWNDERAGGDSHRVVQSWIGDEREKNNEDAFRTTRDDSGKSQMSKANDNANMPWNADVYDANADAFDTGAGSQAGDPGAGQQIGTQSGNQDNAPFPWDRNSVADTATAASGQNQAARASVGGGGVGMGEKQDFKVKSYWSSWNRSRTARIRQQSPKGQSRSEGAFVAEEDPLYSIPEEAMKQKSVSHQVQGGRPAVYSHKQHRPLYMDTTESPYAVFVFKYRSRDVLERLLKINIPEDMEDEKSRLRSLSKDQVIEELLKARVSDTPLCGPKIIINLRDGEQSKTSPTGSVLHRQPDASPSRGSVNGGSSLRDEGIASVNGGSAKSMNEVTGQITGGWNQEASSNNASGQVIGGW